MRILIRFKRLNVIKGGRGTEMWASLFSDQKKLDAACFRTVKQTNPNSRSSEGLFLQP